MKVSIKKLKDLERKILVTIPVNEYELKFSTKLKNIRTKAKVDGFRKGNVPNEVLEQKYGASMHNEVINELIQETYPKAISENNIRPASSPQISIDSEDPKKPLSYSAIIEVFPEIKPKLSRWTNYEEFEIEVEENDINLAIDDIKKRYGDWNDVQREARLDDQVVIDFIGKIDGKEFEGNTANDFKLVLGSKSMIPGFEDSIIGKKPSKFSIECTFPEDYFKKDLAGVKAEFEINLKDVQEMKEANIDKDLFDKLQMEIKDKSEFKNEITSRMKNEVATQEKELTKESMYETLLKTNNFKIPNATVNQQADLMRKDALMRIGHSEDNAGDDLFPIESFMEKAEKRVKLDLLFAELVNHFDIKVEKQNIDDFIDKESKRYKDPEQYKKWITGQPQQLEQFKMIVLEKQLVEKLENVLKSKKKVIKFSELANR
ncbi:MAG: trigger factor [SAR86 cluster bacterium]|jgi:trigger factor|uniref:Trigger factor n=1 Tax=SAR86 cluster bacterium TaxID=2030880 RepID=A0A520N4D3_9GAMM|nr:MAG: trigger factor [SAR86 cluster bacterium]